MTIPDRIPADSARLLKMLDKAFPHRCPRRGEDAEEVQRYAGKRELIDALLIKATDPNPERSIVNNNWIDEDDNDV